MFVNVSLLSPPLPFFSQPAVSVFTGYLLFTRCASRGTLAQSLPGEEEGRTLRLTDAQEQLARQQASSDLREQSTRGVEKSKRLL